MDRETETRRNGSVMAETTTDLEEPKREESGADSTGERAAEAGFAYEAEQSDVEETASQQDKKQETMLLSQA
ncbi:unnamed protein product [Lasius platythorax]|uniref:Uncharacterized protein n=1 Tax=Lasius platythorax TaxID=488582 RepID=A0AAV2MYZ4_9HYME